MKKAAAAAEKARVKAERRRRWRRRWKPWRRRRILWRIGTGTRRWCNQRKRRAAWTRADALDASFVNREVLIRGRIHNVRGKGKSAFIVLRQQTATVQVTMFVDDVHVSKGMVKWRRAR